LSFIRLNNSGHCSEVRVFNVWLKIECIQVEINYGMLVPIVHYTLYWPYMYTLALHVYIGPTCIHWPYMYTLALHVYIDPTCIHWPYTCTLAHW